MKKIYLVLLALCFSVGVVAQNEYESQFMRFYLPDCTGSPFPTSVDTYIVVSEHGQMYVKIHANFAYNAAELSYFQKYAIPKGSNIFFKLDNGEVMTFTCSIDKNVKDGLVTTNNGVYQNYSGYSYFPIDEAAIDKLREHNIIKIRGQFTSEIMDGSLQFTPESNMPETKVKFSEAEQIIMQKYNTAKNRSDEQKVLEQNPLYNF